MLEAAIKVCDLKELNSLKRHIFSLSVLSISLRSFLVTAVLDTSNCTYMYINCDL